MARRRVDIYAKRRLSPGQLRSVAEQRLGDARCLVNHKRSTGAAYVGGFVIECLLKALLLERHPNLQAPVDPAQLSESDREVHELIYRSHELDRMLIFLPEVRIKFEATGSQRWARFLEICEEWTVYARYSPTKLSISDAREFVARVEEVKPWLRDP